jgi:hypothetical protein
MVLDGALQVPIPDLPREFDRRRAVPQSGWTSPPPAEGRGLPSGTPERRRAASRRPGPLLRGWDWIGAERQRPT